MTRGGTILKKKKTCKMKYLHKEAFLLNPKHGNVIKLTSPRFETEAKALLTVGVREAIEDGWE